MIERLSINDSSREILTICRFFECRFIESLFPQLLYLPSTCWLGWSGLCRFYKLQYLPSSRDTLDQYAILKLQHQKFRKIWSIFFGLYRYTGSFLINQNLYGCVYYQTFCNLQGVNNLWTSPQFSYLPSCVPKEIIRVDDSYPNSSDRLTPWCGSFMDASGLWATESYFSSIFITVLYFLSLFNASCTAKYQSEVLHLREYLFKDTL